MNLLSKNIKKALVITLASAMVVGTIVPTSPVIAKSKVAIIVSNKRTVLVSGRRYYVKNDNAKDFKSSNKEVATISDKGTIVPKKTGYVTISAIVNGKTIKTKFLCVSKTGTTNSQTKVDKMLKAPNVKKITIKNTISDKNYIIKKGDYSKKTLVVKVPLSDVKNSGTFSKVYVKDVKNGTFTNYATNEFVITDDDFRFIEKAKESSIQVAEGASGTVKVSGKKVSVVSEGELNLEATKNATFDTVTVKGGQFTFDAAKEPDVKEIVVKGKANIKIVGETKADIPIVIEKTAEGTTLDTSCSVKLKMEAKADVTLTEAAGGSEIKVSKDIQANIKVDKSITENVKVGTIGSNQFKDIEAGAEVSVEVGGNIKDANNNTGGIISGGGSVTPVTNPRVDSNYANKITTYTLLDATSFDTLTSFDVILTASSGKTATFTVDNALMTDVNKKLSLIGKADDALKEIWEKTDIDKTYGNVSIKTETLEGNSATKLITVTGASNTSMNGTFKAELDKSVTGKLKVTIQRADETGNVVGIKKLQITKEGDTLTAVLYADGEKTYTATRNSDTQFHFETAKGGTYDVTIPEDHKSFTVSGNTTEKIKITNVK